MRRSSSPFIDFARMFVSVLIDTALDGIVIELTQCTNAKCKCKSGRIQDLHRTARQKWSTSNTTTSSSSSSTRRVQFNPGKEIVAAYRLLKLKDSATVDDVRAARRRAMKDENAHPDRGGSTKKAAKINAAHDLLIKHITENR